MWAKEAEFLIYFYLLFESWFGVIFLAFLSAGFALIRIPYTEILKA